MKYNVITQNKVTGENEVTHSFMNHNQTATYIEDKGE